MNRGKLITVILIIILMVAIFLGVVEWRELEKQRANREQSCFQLAISTSTPSSISTSTPDILNDTGRFTQAVFSSANNFTQGWPEDFFKEVPFYPGFSDDETYFYPLQLTGRWIIFAVNDSAETVIEFYQETLEKDDWTVSQPIEINETTVRTLFSKQKQKFYLYVVDLIPNFVTEELNLRGNTFVVITY